MSILGARPKFGVLLPTFGSSALTERMRELGPLIEDLGYDAVWVRDQLAARPLGFEHRDRTFVDPFVALAAVAATTRHLQLGTAVLVPVRHPIVVAQLLSGLLQVGGPGRLIVGVGAGFQRVTFETLGLDYERRTDYARDLVRGLRALWAGPDAAFEGTFVHFDGVTIDPRPNPPFPIWFGGSSGAAVRFALDHCDGWLPGRCPYAVFDRLVATARSARSSLSLATIPVVVLGRDRETALAHVDMTNVLADAAQRPAWRAVADFTRAEDMFGGVIAGSIDDCHEGLSAWLARGIEHLVIDLRFTQERFEEDLRTISREILPALRVAPNPVVIRSQTDDG